MLISWPKVSVATELLKSLELIKFNFTIILAYIVLCYIIEY